MNRTCAILVLNYNGRPLLEENIPGVVAAARYAGARHDVIVVDNASSDDSVAFVQAKFPDVKVMRMAQNRRLFSYNDAVRACSHDYVILLNNDIRVQPDFIPPLLEGLNDPTVFATTPKVVSDNPAEACMEPCPGVFHRGLLGTGRTGQPGGSGPTLMAHGGAAAYDREKFLLLGGYDITYWPEYYQDIALSYLAWMRGYKILFEPRSVVFHPGGATLNKMYSDGARRRIRERGAVIFILQNIADPGLLLQFFLWAPPRLLKAAATGDVHRLGAYWDAARRMPLIWRARRAAQRDRKLSDRAILAALRRPAHVPDASHAPA
ncbi:MAG: glycosyltransferase [Dehalococcoidia bacterium]|nr:glycosyltransferase [Dehalococcoidia bacterium]